VRRGKPAVAAGACFSHAAFELLVGAAAPALAAYAFGDAEGSNPGLARDVFRHLFSNEVVVSTAFVVALAVYMAFAVPWAHEWRVGRGAACGFLAAYFVFSLFHGCVETGVLFREPWFGEGR
jgi:Ca2+/Na+ antiporter